MIIPFPVDDEGLQTPLPDNNFGQTTPTSSLTFLLTPSLGHVKKPSVYLRIRYIPFNFLVHIPGPYTYTYHPTLPPPTLILRSLLPHSIHLDFPFPFPFEPLVYCGCVRLYIPTLSTTPLSNLLNKSLNSHVALGVLPDTFV